MPLTQKIPFKTAIQQGNRLQIPKAIRWQFKIEPDQLLKVGVKVLNQGGGWQFFYAKMTKDGRVNITNLTMALLQNKDESLLGCIVEVTLEPT